MAKVLIMTNSNDGSHTDTVIDNINERGSTSVRLNTDEITSGRADLALTEDGKIILSTSDGEHNLGLVDSVWLRRSRVLDFNVNNKAQRVYTENEFKSFIYGVYSLLEDKYWLNTPQAMDKAKLKIYQLSLARDIGLSVPDTIVTNNPDTALQFISSGKTIFKPLSESNIDSDGGALLVPTTLLSDEHIKNINLIRNQYILLQRYIEKQYELRITFIDGNIFVAKQTPINYDAYKVTDWRLLQINGGSTYEVSSVDDSMCSQIMEMMQRLDLRFATLDIAVDSQGHNYFLEVNPNGQWYGYTDEIGMPASSLIAESLVKPQAERIE